jgi:hypothetical protein
MTRPVSVGGEPDSDELVVAIDEILVGSAAGKGPETVLHSSDFVWVSRKNSGRIVRNASDKEARFVTLAFKPI